MYHLLKKSCLGLAVALGLAACGGREASPDVSGIQVELDLVRLDQQIPHLNTPAEAQKFLDANRAFGEVFLMRSQLPHDSVAVNQMLKLGSSPNIDTLAQEAQAYYGDMADLKAGFVKAFKTIKYYYPDFVVPKVYTVVTGYSNDLTVTDSAVFVGLDYFLGKRSRYRSPDPAYIIDQYSKEALVPAVVMMISTKYNDVDPLDRSLLNQMLAYGKAYEFTSRALPGVPDSLVIRYTDQQMVDCQANAAYIYAHFVKENLFFDPSREISKKYLEQRPAVVEIGSKCPGRVGTWLGWQIVRAYLDKHPETTLPQLMKMTKAQEILEQAKYRPEK
jgi:hypothetical protein